MTEKTQSLTAASNESSMPRAFPATALDPVVSFIARIAELRGWSLCVHCVMLVAIIWIPAFAVEWTAEKIFSGSPSANPFTTPLAAIAGAILLAPLSETLAMRLIFSLLRKISKNPLFLSIVSALIWVPLHATYAGWGAHAAWPFFVLNVCYLSLERISLMRAFWMTALLHGIVNTLGYAYYLIFELR